MVIGDTVFADAVAAIDAGDISRVDSLISQNPRLVTERLVTQEPGYFADPYLLWFVAENPIRNDRLPANIIAVTTAIIDHIDSHAPASRQAQLNYTVELVATGSVPREAGVQLAMIDALVGRGARPCGLDAAVAHAETAAARRLIHHGAPVTLAAALCLDLDADAKRLLTLGDPAGQADALLAAAGLGLPAAVRRLLEAGVDPNLRSARLHRHASALHQAALTGREDLCLMLVNAGASLSARDDIWNGTPSGWAAHAGHGGLARLLAARD